MEFLGCPLLTLGYLAFSVHDGWGLILAPAIAAGASGKAIATSIGPGGEGLFVAPTRVFLESWLVLQPSGSICLLVGVVTTLCQPNLGWCPSLS